MFQSSRRENVAASAWAAVLLLSDQLVGIGAVPHDDNLASRLGQERTRVFQQVSRVELNLVRAAESPQKDEFHQFRLDRKFMDVISSGSQDQSVREQIRKHHGIECIDVENLHVHDIGPERSKQKVHLYKRRGEYPSTCELALAGVFESMDLVSVLRFVLESSE